jgi:hypothetical protein
LRALAAGESDLDGAVHVLAAESAWVDVAPGQGRSLADQVVKEARRQVENQIAGALMQQGGRIFEMVRQKAAQVVAEVAALPPLPSDVWSTNRPGQALARFPAHRSTYGTLLSAHQDFSLCHTVADPFRDNLGYSQDHLDGAPPSALAYRNWKAVLADLQWFNVAATLKLKYAVEHDFRPGLWLPSEVEVKPEDKTFGARLRNLGSAVLSGS